MGILLGNTFTLYFLILGKRAGCYFSDVDVADPLVVWRAFV